ncbi:hypothetical protein FisN_14Hu262 [Fistulifera solaris]|uniref:Uncharacterized protein n=1 Tax=Fistulifera solaris TaxID=1519565 RepID=A0A1Z5KB97_FISSO|nr:hypothetical protein FisN_14Hu262 [Fistulifera solaris]|eukprot:GAX23560.1 hypothetical protein FisN_14Hu262 [Fistulifera solaris]
MIVEDDDTTGVCYPTHSYTDGAGCDCDCECCVGGEHPTDDDGDDYVVEEDDDAADDDYAGKRGGRILKKSGKGKGKGKGGKGKGKGKGHHHGKGKGKGHHCPTDDVVCSCDCYCPDSGSKSGSKSGEGSLECCEYEKICPTGESGASGKYGRKFRGLATGDGCEYVCVSYCDGGWRK